MVFVGSIGTKTLLFYPPLKENLHIMVSLLRNDDYCSYCIQLGAGWMRKIRSKFLNERL